MTKIYVYKDQKGKRWADFKLPDGLSRGNILQVLDAEDPKKVLDNPGQFLQDRVRGLAQRLIDERTEIIEKTTVVEKLPAMSFWQRLVWLTTGAR